MPVYGFCPILLVRHHMLMLTSDHFASYDTTSVSMALIAIREPLANGTGYQIVASPSGEISGSCAVTSKQYQSKNVCDSSR